MTSLPVELCASRQLKIISPESMKDRVRDIRDGLIEQERRKLYTAQGKVIQVLLGLHSFLGDSGPPRPTFFFR